MKDKLPHDTSEYLTGEMLIEAILEQPDLRAHFVEVQKMRMASPMFDEQNLVDDSDREAVAFLKHLVDSGTEAEIKEFLREFFDEPEGKHQLLVMEELVRGELLSPEARMALWRSALPDKSDEEILDTKKRFDIMCPRTERIRVLERVQASKSNA